MIGPTRVDKFRQSYAAVYSYWYTRSQIKPPPENHATVTATIFQKRHIMKPEQCHKLCQFKL